MVYVYYNIRLWVRQLQKTTNVEGILLDGIDTTTTWRVETERHVMDLTHDWLQEEAQEEVGGECIKGGGCSREDTFTGGDY
jgi:hypothetical protein